MVGLGQFGIGTRGVNLGRADLGMSHQLPQTGDWHPRIGQLSRKGMAQLVRGQMKPAACP